LISNRCITIGWMHVGEFSWCKTFKEKSHNEILSFLYSKFYKC